MRKSYNYEIIYHLYSDSVNLRNAGSLDPEHWLLYYILFYISMSGTDTYYLHFLP